MLGIIGTLNITLQVKSKCSTNVMLCLKFAFAKCPPPTPQEELGHPYLLTLLRE